MKHQKKANDAAYKAATGTKTKYAKQQVKADKAHAKNLKAQKKYDKWVKAMDEVFTSDLMKTITPAAISNAEEYARTIDYLLMISLATG